MNLDDATAAWLAMLRPDEPAAPAQPLKQMKPRDRSAPKQLEANQVGGSPPPPPLCVAVGSA